MARLIGADGADVALIPSVSSAAGLVAAQFGPAHPGENIVIGQREYSSNHFPWRQLAGKGYDVNAGRGMGYCYLSPAAQARFTPVNAGWRAGHVPLDSFFGPQMNLSATASRFDTSIS